MPRPHYALAALALLGWFTAVSGQSPLTPQTGLLVLRNGQVLAGEVTQAGDYYVVTIGGRERSPPEGQRGRSGVRSLEEAYDFKAGHLSGTGARPHLELAEWCLRHNLHARCAQQLVAAMRLEPENAALKLLERRLEFATLEPKPQAAAASTGRLSSAPSRSNRQFASCPRGASRSFPPWCSRSC